MKALIGVPDLFCLLKDLNIKPLSASDKTMNGIPIAALKKLLKQKNNVFHH